jgi:hypothetical protein
LDADANAARVRGADFDSGVVSWLWASGKTS